MAGVLPDQDTPYDQLSQEEQDLPHNIFLELGRRRELEEFVEELEANPIPLDRLHQEFRNRFPLYDDLYTRKPDLQDPFCTEGFEDILAEARRNPGAGTIFIILIILACLKPPPGDQLPLDPSAPGPSAKKERRGAAIIRRLFKLMVATLEVLCPCGGPSADGRAERRGINRQSQPTVPLYAVSKLFTRAVVACLKRDNIEIDHGYAEGGWAATMLEVKRNDEKVDLGTFPKFSPILGCPVYSNYYPRAILRDQLPFPRSIHLLLNALAFSHQLSMKPLLQQISLRKIYNAIALANQDDDYPIGDLDYVLNAIGKNEDDPIQELVDALIQARDEYGENGGLYRAVRTEGGGCGMEGAASFNERYTLKYQCWVLHEAGHNVQGLTVKEVVTLFWEGMNRVELVRKWNVPADDVVALSKDEVHAQLWMRRNKAYLAKNNINVATLQDNEVYPLSVEIAARAQLVEEGVEGAETMSRDQVNKAVHPLRVSSYLHSIGVDTTGMSDYELKSTYFKESKMIPQAERLRALLDEEDYLPLPIPEPVNHRTKVTLSQPIDPTLPLSSFVNEQTAHQFYETIRHGKFRNSGLDFADLLAAFPPSIIFRLIQFFPHDDAGARARKSGCKQFGNIIDRALYQEWFGKKDAFDFPKTNKKEWITERGMNKVVMGRTQGWKGALEKYNLRIVLTDETPQHLRPQIEQLLSSSPWIDGGMKCGDLAYMKEQSPELKWFALFFSSPFWALEKVEGGQSGGAVSDDEEDGAFDASGGEVGESEEE